MEQNNNIVTYKKLTNIQREEFIDILLNNFGVLFNFKQDMDKFKILLSTSFHDLNSYAYVQNNKVLGILLISTNKLRPLKINEQLAIELFGRSKGSSMCKKINMMFQNKVVDQDTDMYIDILGVSIDARKQGIGTKLLNFAFSIPTFETYYLEFLSKSTNVKRLYESLGFSIIKKSYFSPIRIIGHGYPIKMKK